MASFSQHNLLQKIVNMILSNSTPKIRTNMSEHAHTERDESGLVF